MNRRADEESERLELSKAAETLIDECRMVLPGIQAIFGFQLIAVFNQRFTDLDPLDVRLHFAALALIALAAALVMTPAALHRHRGVRVITSTFLDVSSVLLVSSMVPLALGLAIDCYVITHLAFDQPPVAAGFGGALLALMFFLWFVFPRLDGAHAWMARQRRKGTAART